jgi:hypothetical protein
MSLEDKLKGIGHRLRKMLKNGHYHSGAVARAGFRGGPSRGKKTGCNRTLNLLWGPVDFCTCKTTAMDGWNANFSRSINLRSTFATHGGRSLY